MKVLVTGGTGFIGQRLVERLCRAGMAVRCLARAPGRAAALRQLGAELVPGELAEGAGLKEAVAGMEGVVHLGGVIRAWGRQAYFSVNEQGTRQLAEAARDAGVGRFVLVSSLAAVGPGDPGGAVTEERAPRPVNSYGESKLAGERALAAVAGPMAWSVARPCVVYGPGDRDTLALFRLAALGLVPYPAPRGARLSLIHVDDLVELLLACLVRAPGRSFYMASDGEAYSWRAIIEALGKALGKVVSSWRVPPWCLWPVAVASAALRPFTARPPLLCLDKLREALQPSWVASSGRARAELGWSPRFGLEAGLRSALEWYREQGWL